jgi:endonuclease/exonuclease/phosphatase family metal-dependent hydrolase
VRVLTLNVQGFREGVDRVGQVIRATDPDAVMLNEAFRGPTMRLAAENGRVVVFGATRPLRGFGNAILLREPPHVKRRFMFRRTRGYAPRGAIAAGTASGIMFVAVHLGLSGDERVQHALQLVGVLERYTKVVIAGDLNEGPDGPAVRVVAGSYHDVFAAVGEGSGDTFPMSDPLYRIDYVFCSGGLTPARATVVPIVASDHLAVLAEIARVQDAPSASAS